MLCGQLLEMKKIDFLLILALVSALLPSCNSSSNKKQDVLSVGVMPSMDYLPLVVAQREGYFKEIGLNIDLQKFYSANERDAAFQSKNIDGTIIDFTGAILQKSGGIDLKLTSKCDAPFYIVANNSIQNLSELKDKKVAVSRNTVIDFIVDMALKSVGLNDNDIQKTEINKIPVRYEMLRNNKIDATGLPNPFALMAKQEGDKILTSNDSLGFSITGIMFHQSSINSKQEQIEKMYIAYNKGVDYIKSHPIDDIKDILIKNLGFPENIVAITTLPNYTHAQMPSDKDIQLTSEWLKSKKLIDTNFNQSSLIDAQFIK